MKSLRAILTVLLFTAFGWGVFPSTTYAQQDRASAVAMTVSMVEGAHGAANLASYERCAKGMATPSSVCSTTCYTLSGEAPYVAANEDFSVAFFESGRGPLLRGSLSAPDPFPPRLTVFI